MSGGNEVVAVLLAGGLSRRMGGGDKTLRPLGGRPILEHVVDRVRPQAHAAILNANGDPARFAHLGLPVVEDSVEGFAGPLAGIHAALRWSERQAPATRWVVSIATDTPFLPEDLVARFLAAVEEEDAELACAASGGRTHPVFGLWPVRLADALEHALRVEGMRKIDAWTKRYRLAIVPFSAQGYDPFFNVNTPEDLATAEALLADTSG